MAFNTLMLAFKLKSLRNHFEPNFRKKQDAREKKKKEEEAKAALRRKKEEDEFGLNIE